MTNKVQIDTVPQLKSNKMAKLVLGIFFDLIGMVSYVIPVLAEVLDVIWAPVSGLILASMYKGNAGKAAAAFGFLEEILPGTDVIPTFTLTWIYTYIIKKEN